MAEDEYSEDEFVDGAFDENLASDASDESLPDTPRATSATGVPLSSLTSPNEGIRIPSATVITAPEGSPPAEPCPPVMAMPAVRPAGSPNQQQQPRPAATAPAATEQGIQTDEDRRIQAKLEQLRQEVQALRTAAVNPVLQAIDLKLHAHRRALAAGRQKSPVVRPIHVPAGRPMSAGAAASFGRGTHPTWAMRSSNGSKLVRKGAVGESGVFATEWTEVKSGEMGREAQFVVVAARRRARSAGQLRGYGAIPAAVSIDASLRQPNVVLFRLWRSRGAASCASGRQQASLGGHRAGVSGTHALRVCDLYSVPGIFLTPSLLLWPSIILEPQ
jgi:hypothetical protein